MLHSGISLPNGYQQRLQNLLKAQWKVGESYAQFAHRLGIGSSRTAKAWLMSEIRTEPDAGKLRHLAKSVGWKYWELVRYLDTGEPPEPSKKSPFSIPPTSKTALVTSAKEMRDLADRLYRSLDSVPPRPEPQPIQATPPGIASCPYPPLPKPPKGLPVETKTLSQMMQECLDQSRLTERDLEERLRDRNYSVSSRDIVSRSDFDAMREGEKLPQSETQLEVIANVVDRDREYFSQNYWLKAWIFSIYAQSHTKES